MLKINLVYPVSIKNIGGKIILVSDHFKLQIEALDIQEGLKKIKGSIVLAINDYSKKGKALPVPDLDNVDLLGNTIFIELDSTQITSKAERVNMTIPSNLLTLIDHENLNRSNYISDLIWKDMQQRYKSKN